MNRYKEAGVDVTAGYDLVNRIKPLVAATKRKGVRAALVVLAGCSI